MSNTSKPIDDHIDANLPDNNTGLITPLALRSVLHELSSAMEQVKTQAPASGQPAGDLGALTAKLEKLTPIMTDISKTVASIASLAADGAGHEDFDSFHEAMTWACDQTYENEGTVTLLLKDGVHEMGAPGVITDSDTYGNYYTLNGATVIIKSDSQKAASHPDPSLVTLTMPAASTDDGPLVFANVGSTLTLWNLTFDGTLNGYDMMLAKHLSILEHNFGNTQVLNCVFKDMGMPVYADSNGLTVNQCAFMNISGDAVRAENGATVLIGSAKPPGEHIHQLYNPPLNEMSFYGSLVTDGTALTIKGQPLTSGLQPVSEKGKANGYAGLDANSKVPSSFLPASTATPHHLFATQAAMLAGSSAVKSGELVLVHGDSAKDKNGEYVALKDAPTVIADFDHIGEHVRAHRYDADDIDVGETFSKRRVHLQAFFDEQYQPVQMPQSAITCGYLRTMMIGRTYKFPHHPEKIQPGLDQDILISETNIAGVYHPDHRYVNAIIVRTGSQTWAMHAQEFSASEHQPTFSWDLDLDPDWPDHTGIGDLGSRSFTSTEEELARDIGDIDRFGSDTVVDRITAEEEKHNSLSKRLAILEGSAHGHVDVVQDFKMAINNQGPGYLIAHDQPTNPDHLGKDLFDEKEHKVLFEYIKNFDPAHFEDPDGSGHFHDWTAGRPPSVWIERGGGFKQFVDPVSGNVIGWTTMQSFIAEGSVVTLKWDKDNTRLLVMKVEQGTEHKITTPDHAPLQRGGEVKAKFLPLEPVLPAHLGDIANNSLWLDEHNVLQFRDHTGADKPVTLT